MGTELLTNVNVIMGYAEEKFNWQSENYFFDWKHAKHFPVPQSDICLFKCDDGKVYGFYKDGCSDESERIKKQKVKSDNFGSYVQLGKNTRFYIGD